MALAPLGLLAHARGLQYVEPARRHQMRRTCLPGASWRSRKRPAAPHPPLLPVSSVLVPPPPPPFASVSLPSARYKFNSRMDQPPGSLNGGNNLPFDLDAIDAEPVNPLNVSVWDWRQLGKVTPAKDQGEVRGARGQRAWCRT